MEGIDISYFLLQGVPAENYTCGEVHNYSQYSTFKLCIHITKTRFYKMNRLLKEIPAINGELLVTEL